MGANVRIDADGSVATLTLSRGHGNAINEALVDALTAACDRVEADPEIRGVILAAEGKLFCPGLDLRELIHLDRADMGRMMLKFGECVRRLYALRKPMIAALDGHALAGGCVLALTADWRVLAPEVLIGLNEVRVGVPFPFGVAQILRESIPRTHLEEVALLGNNYRDEAAVAVGLVHELHPLEDFESYCRSRLEEFVARDAFAVGLTKQYLRHPVLERIRETEARHVEEFLDGWFRPETQSRIRALVASLDKS